jgi:hypothetical protein
MFVQVSSLQVLCMNSIINNNLNYFELSYTLSDMIDYEKHKQMFKDTLYILNTISYEMNNVKDFILVKVKPVVKEIFENWSGLNYDNYSDINDEKYNFIFVKFLYRRGNIYESTRFIQELSNIEFE